jgi:hypothetical protein
MKLIFGIVRFSYFSITDCDENTLKNVKGGCFWYTFSIDSDSGDCFGYNDVVVMF